ncbi:hypothetical protein [Enterococcus nangangensis]|uniref:hypothetical protein n=1 Tax=Enterococcus nangangensis TaxID=2559926 RepID=UPI0010F875F2|nr:hypothetical protein [Enterococcus nangangensis]
MEDIPEKPITKTTLKETSVIDYAQHVTIANSQQRYRLPLTAIETQVKNLFAKGFSVAEIAASLETKPIKIKSILCRINHKSKLD